MEDAKIDIIKNLLDTYKGKRKFVQSVEIAVNFKGVDFTKQDNRLNLSVSLPNGRGKAAKVLVYADKKEIVDAANATGSKVIGAKDIEPVSKDKEKMKELLNYVSLAEPALMSTVARYLGAYLGPKGRMPKPLVGSDPKSVITNITRSVSITTRGKFLPTVHCIVGSETMDIKGISENITAVLEALNKAVGTGKIKSVYLKLSMSPPVKFI